MTWMDRITEGGVTIRDSRNAEEIAEQIIADFVAEARVRMDPEATVGQHLKLLIGVIAHTIVNEREEAIRRAREE